MKNKKTFGSSLNGQEEILEFLKSKAPEVFSEGKIDCKKLKNTIGDVAEDGEERYGISWAGKNDCFRNIQEQTTATLKPNKDESVDFEKTGNLFIEGDNLEVLKVLQRSYYGKIKMIYIDPPYNTGNDFIYNDKFAKSRDEYLEEIGEKDGNGNTLRVDGLSKNSKDSGHYHSNWLNMMYPRLFLARNLLRQDGVIFVSIDDNEVHNLRMIMNEIFGEENFEGHIHWRRRHNQPNDKTKMIGLVAEHILVYCKNSNAYKISGVGKIELTGNFSNPDNDPRGDWASKPWKIGSSQNGSRYIIISPSGKSFNEEWMGDENNYKKLLKDNRIYFPDNGNGFPRKKYFKFEREEEGQCATNWWSHEIFGSNQEATKELQRTFDLDDVIFDNPKPVKLLASLIQLANCKSNDIVLDFFAGSGTTAQSVMSLNKFEELNIKWICVQIPEMLDEDSVSDTKQKKTVKNAINFLKSIGKPLNVAELCKERIKRAGKKIKEDISAKGGPASGWDSGFKVFRLDNSNFKIWQGKFENHQSLLDNMKEFVDNVKSDSTQGNLLYEVIIKSGLDLNVKVEEKGNGEDKYYCVDGGKLIIYLGKKISQELASEFQKAKPEKIVCLDRCFNNNDQLKTNIMLQMEQEKIDFKVI